MKVAVTSTVGTVNHNITMVTGGTGTWNVCVVNTDS